MWLPPLFICVAAFVFFGILSASPMIEMQPSHCIIQKDLPRSILIAIARISLSTYPRAKHR
jgi:hypothetical protein